MAWVLVKWIEEDSVSVIPSSWVISPTPLPDELPVEGVCFWKKKTNILAAVVMAVSGKKMKYYAYLSHSYPCNYFVDVKEDLEELELEQENNEPENKENETSNVIISRKKETGKKREAEDDDAVVKTKKRKEEREQKKNKKLAEVAAADEMANKIFQFKSTCKKCMLLEHKITNIEREMEKKDRELEEKESQIRDLKDSLEAKKAVISNFEKDLDHLKTRRVDQNGMYQKGF